MKKRTGIERKRLHSRKDVGKIEFRKSFFFPANRKYIFFIKKKALNIFLLIEVNFFYFYTAIIDLRKHLSKRNIYRYSFYPFFLFSFSFYFFIHLLNFFFPFYFILGPTSSLRLLSNEPSFFCTFI